MMTFRERTATFWHLLLITLWGIPLITPLLRWTAVSCTHDGHLHYHRVAALRHAWENGLYFSRWMPDLAFGYGYPFFVYREPLPLYAVLWPHLLGLPLPAATNLFYIITVLACGYFMFLWARDILGNWGGLVAAMAYMTAPYVLIDALIRGNSPESAALPLFPLLLWASRRWLLDGGAKWFGTAVIGLILLAFSHNISLLIFTPTLLVYLLALAWQHKLKWRLWLARLGLLFGLGLGITLFYTGGALLELNSVTLEQSTSTRNNDFHFNFTSPAEILAPVAPEDPSLLNPPLPFRLGWVVMGLATLGVGFTIYDLRFTIDHRDSNRQSKIVNRKFHTVLMLIGTAVFLFISLPASQFIWEGLPLIDFVQFPWRFVGRAALPLAFLAGVPFADFSHRGKGGTERRRGRWVAVFVGVAVGLLVLEAIPTVYPNICTEESFPTINTVHSYERETGLVGVDPEGSYFPRTVAERPSGSPLETDFQADEIPQRFDTAVLPPSSSVESIQQDSLSVTVQLNSPEPFIARYLSFNFPGWVAKIDGQTIPITPEKPSGLITFPVPAGSHTLTVQWQSTPVRTLLMGLSLMALAGVAVVVLVLAKTEYSVFSIQYSVVSEPTDYWSLITDHWSLFLLAALLILGKTVIGRSENPLRRAAGPTVAQTAVLQAAELRLEGFNLNKTAVVSGDIFDIDLAWTATDFPQARYQSNVWLVGPDGLVWSDLDTQRPRLYEDMPPTLFWQPAQWGWDSREVRVLRGTPPGQYDIVVQLFDLATLRPVTLQNQSGEVLGVTAVIGQMQVVRPDETTLAVDSLGTISGVSLLEFRQDRTEAVVGDELLLTFFWQWTSGTPVEDTFYLQLLDSDDNVAFNWKRPFSLSRYSPVYWQANEQVRGQHLYLLPAGLDSGRYRFAFDGLVLGAIDITVPERVFEPVEMETAVSTTFHSNSTPLITLIGLTQSSIQNRQSSIDLLWRAEAELSASYHVFIHLVDGDGQILAQSDGEPANWQRPTSSWVAGEYILDTHTLTLPPDLPSNTSLRIGLYIPATNYRLQTETADFVTIP